MWERPEDINYDPDCQDRSVLSDRPVKKEDAPKYAFGSYYYEQCDMCNHMAFYKYSVCGKILFRCKMHKIIDLKNLKHKYSY